MALKMTRPHRLPEGADRFLWTAVPVPVPLPVSFVAVLKFSPDQARDPKGTPTGGRFARGPIEQKYRNVLAKIRQSQREYGHVDRLRQAMRAAWQVWSKDLVEGRKKPLKADGQAAKKLESYKKAQALENELHARIDTADAEHRTRVQQIKDMLKVPVDQRSKVMFTEDTVSPIHSALKRSAEVALETFRQYDGSGAFDPIKLPPEITRERAETFLGKGNFVETADGRLEIPVTLRLGKAVSGRASANMAGILIHGRELEREVFHEVAHHLEFKNGAILRASVELREKLAAPGHQIYQLNELNKGLGNEEIALRGNFPDPYSAKIYPSDISTEMVSTGVESYLLDPVRFAEDRPEHFKFIFEMMHGKYRNQS